MIAAAVVGTILSYLVGWLIGFWCGRQSPSTKGRS